jgi:hypothetical protein
MSPIAETAIVVEFSGVPPAVIRARKARSTQL